LDFLLWLRKGELFQTFDNEIQCDVTEIKQLLNEEEENNEEQSPY
jgi:hypothetical protein